MRLRPAQASETCRVARAGSSCRSGPGTEAKAQAEGSGVESSNSFVSPQAAIAGNCGFILQRSALRPNSGDTRPLAKIWIIWSRFKLIPNMARQPVDTPESSAQIEQMNEWGSGAMC